MHASSHNVENDCTPATPAAAQAATGAAAAAATVAAAAAAATAGATQLEQLLLLGTQRASTAGAEAAAACGMHAGSLPPALREQLVRQRRMRLRVPCGGTAAPFATGTAFTHSGGRHSPFSISSTGNGSNCSSTGDSTCASADAHQSDAHVAARSRVKNAQAEGESGATAATASPKGEYLRVVARSPAAVAAPSDASASAGESRSSNSADSKVQLLQPVREEAGASASGGAHPLNNSVVSEGSLGASAAADVLPPVCETNGTESAGSHQITQRAKRVHFAAEPLLRNASASERDTAAAAGGRQAATEAAETVKTGADAGCAPAAAGVASRGEEGRRITLVKDKWRLLPAYLAAKGLVHQHIESYNYFIKRELHEILRAPSNRLVKSDVDPSFFIEFLNIYAGTPCYYEEGMIVQRLTPHICRTRELTYAAPLFVDAEYSRGEEIIRRRKVEIGLLPVMLKSDLCVLHGKDTPALQRLGECPYDPGGYFIVRGTEKVLLMQEQLSKNRIIVELDMKRNVCATVTSATAESKSRTAVVLKNNKLYVRHNSFLDDLPACIVLRAMGLETDQEIVQMIGAASHVVERGSGVCTAQEAVSLSLQDCHVENILTQQQALRWLGGRIRPRMQAKGFFTPMHREKGSAAPRQQQTAAAGAAEGAAAGAAGAAKPGKPGVAGGSAGSSNSATAPPFPGKGQVDEAVDVLHRVVLSHIETTGSDFRKKSRFLSLMIRRVLDAAGDPTLMDDKDYYGNKRLELAGQLLSLLFEDLFKRFCSQLKRQADYALSRYHQTRASSSFSRSSSSFAAAGGDAGLLAYPDCFRNLPTDIITRGMQTALSTGNWTIKRFRMERSGVSQVLSRLSYVATLGMMTRINSQFEKGRKVSGPRALQTSQWGMLCPCDTPEGESCGLVKNLALLTHVTIDEDPMPIAALAFCLGVEDADGVTGEELHDRGTYLVLLNGSLLGVHRRPKQLLEQLRLLRRHGYLGEFVSVHANEAHKAIYLAADGGRLSRPLIVVEDGVSRLQEHHLEQLQRGEISFFDLLRSSVLEWIDVNEENNLLIALREEDLTQDHTHLEIDPLTLLGVVAGLIAFPNHNQSPRNTYQCAMGKQAMGAIAYNQFNRCDTLLYLLVYPQKPLCKSRTLDLVHFEQLPAGQNASVAIMSYSGYDIEDAIILNRASVDRGFGRCFALRRHTVELKKHVSGAVDRTFPPPSSAANPTAAGAGAPGGAAGGSAGQLQQGGGRRSGGSAGAAAAASAAARRFYFSALEDDGVVRVGALVQEDQVYVHRFAPVSTSPYVPTPSASSTCSYAPAFARYKTVVPSYVERVICTENGEGCTTYKVLFRQTRLPELGDKFSSRHGQKGVVGLIAAPEDMPFSETGWCPDLIMNPHGFPSRMTVGKMLELIAGKAGLLLGECMYSTAFGGVGLDTLAEALSSCGFHYSGKEYLTSGTTGEALQTYVFAGPIYYQKLKHMVQDKIHARGRGPRQLLTRQPTEGRAKEGGLRLGEMERDCLVAYGSSALLIERLMLSSDVFDACVCASCGLLGYDGWCSYCRSSESVHTLRMPYACKLLFQELMSMNVCPRLKLKQS